MIVSEFKDQIHVVLGRDTTHVQAASMGYEEEILTNDHRNCIVITDDRYRSISDDKTKDVLNEKHIPIKIHLLFEDKKSIKKLIKKLREIDKNFENNQ